MTRAEDVEVVRELRDEIDTLDDLLVSLIAKRIALAQRVMFEKRERGIDTLDRAREMHILSRVAKQHPQFAEVFKLIIAIGKDV